MVDVSLLTSTDRVVGARGGEKEGERDGKKRGSTRPRNSAIVWRLWEKISDWKNST